MNSTAGYPVHETLSKSIASPASPGNMSSACTTCFLITFQVAMVVTPCCKASGPARDLAWTCVDRPTPECAGDRRSAGWRGTGSCRAPSPVAGPRTRASGSGHSRSDRQGPWPEWHELVVRLIGIGALTQEPRGGCVRVGELAGVLRRGPMVVRGQHCRCDIARRRSGNPPRRSPRCGAVGHA